MRTSLAENPQPIDGPELAAYNQRLTQQVQANVINEKYLEDQLAELTSLDQGRGPRYWLTMARLTELAVFCAGNYADSGELQAVGDLLFNPRQILVHFRDQARAVVKDRHRALTDQFSHMADDRLGVIDWLKQQTMLETTQQPLLPDLLASMTASGFLSPEYLANVDRRLKKIADVVGLVSSCPHPPDVDFTQYLRQCSPAMRAYLEANLCGFDLETFHALGLAVQAGPDNHHWQNSFLNKQAAA